MSRDVDIPISVEAATPESGETPNRNPRNPIPSPMAAIIGDALRQAFMQNREEDKAWGRIQRPLVSAAVFIIIVTVAAAVSVSLVIVMSREPGRRPFCCGRKEQTLPTMNVKLESESYQYHDAFYLSDEEAADYYWMVVFVPSAVVFLASVIFLVAGMSVAYSAPTRHPFLRVVENNYCASKRGGVRCLSILNVVFAVIFAVMALFLGSSLLALGSNCSRPLFWSYEIASWGFVILYGGTAFFLRRKAIVILDGAEFGGGNLGLEMLEPGIKVPPDTERRLHASFKPLMGSSLSSDEEDS